MRILRRVFHYFNIIKDTVKLNRTNKKSNELNDNQEENADVTDVLQTMQSFLEQGLFLFSYSFSYTDN